MKKVGIIGSGSWGVALGIHLANLGNEVCIWSFSEEEAFLINKERKCKFLPNVVVPDRVTCLNDIKKVVEDSQILVHVTPSKFVRETVKKYKAYITNQPIVICSKGFEMETLATLDEVIKEELPNAKISVLSGPSHAEEVSIGVPTAIVVSSKEENLMKEVQSLFMSPTLRVYTCSDMRGVELGGALKNIIAFCAGIATGLNLGDNTFAALITRGLSEIVRLGTKMGAEASTFYGLTGLGDLVVTCLSEHSRNRRAGLLIGQGKSIEEARKEIGMTIESVDNIEVAYQLCKKYDVEMPIVDSVYHVLFDGLDPKEALNDLMTRKPKDEI